LSGFGSDASQHREYMIRPRFVDTKIQPTSR
jgi:hypothetical protein